MFLMNQSLGEKLVAGQFFAESNICRLKGDGLNDILNLIVFFHYIQRIPRALARFYPFLR